MKCRRDPHSKPSFVYPHCHYMGQYLMTPQLGVQPVDVILPISQIGYGGRSAIFERTTFAQRSPLTHALQMMSSIKRFATTPRAFEDPE